MVSIKTALPQYCNQDMQPISFYRHLIKVINHSVPYHQVKQNWLSIVGLYVARIKQYIKLLTTSCIVMWVEYNIREGAFDIHARPDFEVQLLLSL